jgi:hypothetical protein
MRAQIIALIAVALVAAVTPAVISLAAGARPAAAQSHSPHGPPTTVPPCDFDHPATLPSNPNATEALLARSSHCPSPHAPGTAPA